MYFIILFCFFIYRYDLNLVKSGLAKGLGIDERGFVIKRQNAYIAISAEKLKFLDISQYLATGTSYKQFLKAYGVQEDKGFFPYEFLDGPEKLDYENLPPYDAFYSTLKRRNTLEEEVIKWKEGGSKGSQPPSGEDNYRLLLRVWHEQGMKTLRDLLIWYNNKDTGPFVTAVEKMQRFYFEKGIDVFKGSISLPGIARSMIHAYAAKENASFSLIDERNKDLFQTIKRGIVGGPSVVFHRETKAGVTNIRDDPSYPCQRVIGLDANALYLWALSQPMPVGTFVRWRNDGDGTFKPTRRDAYLLMYAWMDSLGRGVLHRMNSGRERRVGPYLVDGYIGDRTVVEFLGCYFHSHTCELTRHVTNRKWLDSKAANYERTLKRLQFLKDEGLEVVHIWECQFRQQIERDTELAAFVSSRYPPFNREHRKAVTTQTLLEGVMSEKFFGMVEVDIQVPDEWEGAFRDELSPFDYFREMSPIFCNTEVPFSVIGEHMQAHVRAHGLSEKPRRLLVGGMRARQILLATPLLKWYLEHGLVVTKVHQAVEWCSSKCFEKFAEVVSDARRQGDIRHQGEFDEEKQIIGATFKLLGNSAYGSLLLDKTKFRKVIYVRGRRQMGQEVNDPRFRKLTELDTTYFEVEKGHRTISQNMPTQLGFFVLTYAKEKMLDFYYSFLCAYIPRCRFHFIQMDTDSAYIGIAGKTLDEVIREDRKEEYRRLLTGNCSKKVARVKEQEWVPRTCCEEDARYDLRTRGLFKIEFQGDGMVALCSKTYLATDQDKSKYSSKGANKASVVRECYTSVLHNRKSRSVVNRGIRVKDNTMFTYEQRRQAFVYFYAKRRVLNDGISTAPLDLELCPS